MVLSMLDANEENSLKAISRARYIFGNPLGMEERKDIINDLDIFTKIRRILSNPVSLDFVDTTKRILVLKLKGNH